MTSGQPFIYYVGQASTLFFYLMILMFYVFVSNYTPPGKATGEMRVVDDYWYMFITVWNFVSIFLKLLYLY